MENKSLSEIFSENLRIEMVKQKVSATELTKQTSVSRNTINLLRSGKAKMIRFNSIDTVCQALSIKPSQLFEQKGK